MKRRCAIAQRGHVYLFATALTFIGVGGCASVNAPPLEPPLPAQWRHAVDAQAPAVDLHRWWNSFGDARLNALVDQALVNNNDAKAALEHVLAARGLRASADANLRPQVHARTYDIVDPNASASYLLVGFDATWELGLFGRAKALREQTQGELDLSDADLQAVRVSLVGEVVRNWLLLRGAQRREQLLAGIVDTQRTELRLLGIRQRLQLVSTADVDRAQAQLSQAQAALVAPRLAMDASTQRLAVLLGRSEPDPAWLTQAPLPRLGHWRMASAPADMLRSRPEIQQAQAHVLSALGDARLARADRFPRLGLGGSLVKSINILSHKNRTDEDSIASFGPTIDIPLFDWGLREAKQQAQQHQLNAAVFAYRQAVLEGVSEVEQALGALAQQAQREQHSSRAAAALGHADSAQAKRVSLHLAGPLDRGMSQRALMQAQLDQLDAREARDLAYVALFKALGGAPLPADDADNSPSLSEAAR